MKIILNKKIIKKGVQYYPLLPSMTHLPAPRAPGLKILKETTTKIRKIKTVPIFDFDVRQNRLEI